MLKKKIEAAARRELSGKSSKTGSKIKKYRLFYLKNLRRAKYSKELKEEMAIYYMLMEDYIKLVNKQSRLTAFAEERLIIQKKRIQALVHVNFIRKVHFISENSGDDFKQQSSEKEDPFDEEEETLLG